MLPRTRLTFIVCAAVSFAVIAHPVQPQAPFQKMTYGVSPAEETPWVTAHSPLSDKEIAKVNLALLAHGNKEAAWELGLAYMQGLGVEQDYAKAEAMFRLGATSPDQKGMVGMFYAGGDFPRNLEAAEKWYSAAGRPQDFFEIAEMYKSAAEKDVVAAEKYYSKATALYLKLLLVPREPQARRAALELGNFVIDGIYNAGNNPRARAQNLAWARQIAQELLGQKDYQIAVAYVLGQDLPKDKALWLRYCKRAAAYDIDNAQHFYVEALNEATAQDFTGYDAIAWTRLNAQKIYAEISLLQAMTSWLSGPQKVQAEAAYRDLLESRQKYGAYYVQDDPLRNPTSAELAAMDQDDPDVQLRQAFNMEKEAIHDPVIYEKVLAVYRTVRNHRDSDCRFVLGRYALYGKNGVPKNRAAAEYWLNEAVRSGSKPAQHLLDEVRSQP